MEVLKLDTKKVMVFGTPRSDKRDMLKKVCNKLANTIPMDYGSAIIDNTKIHFFSPSENKKFSFMNEVLSKKLDGAIIFLNNSQKIDETRIKSIKDILGEAPYIIFTKTIKETSPYLNSESIIYSKVDQSSSTIENGIKTLIKMMST